MTIHPSAVEGFAEYVEIQHEKWLDEGAAFGCAICCGGEELPKIESYWEMKERNVR